MHGQRRWPPAAAGNPSPSPVSKPCWRAAALNYPLQYPVSTKTQHTAGWLDTISQGCFLSPVPTSTQCLPFPPVAGRFRGGFSALPSAPRVLCAPTSRPEPGDALGQVPRGESGAGPGCRGQVQHGGIGAIPGSVSGGGTTPAEQHQGKEGVNAHRRCKPALIPQHMVRSRPTAESRGRVRSWDREH